MVTFKDRMLPERNETLIKSASQKLHVRLIYFMLYQSFLGWRQKGV